MPHKKMGGPAAMHKDPKYRQKMKRYSDYPETPGGGKAPRDMTRMRADEMSRVYAKGSGMNKKAKKGY